MKIHICYFCNYQTPKRGNLISHVTKQNKCSYLIKSIPIDSIERYYELIDLHKEDPDNEIWGIVHNHREYAIIGSTAGTHFFDVTNIQDIQYLVFDSKPKLHCTVCMSKKLFASAEFRWQQNKSTIQLICK